MILGVENTLLILRDKIINTENNIVYRYQNCLVIIIENLFKKTFIGYHIFILLKLTVIS